MELVTANTGRVRRERWRGRDWFVAPVSMIVPGVLPGSRGALYYPPDETAAVVNDWDGMPITVYHPRGPGGHVTANSPEVLQKQGVGLVRRPSFKNKLAAEAWVDAEKVRNVDRRVYEALNAGKPMEVSTGLFTDNEPAANDAHHNGRRYVAVARNHRPDHLAILPDEKGACSLQDGCGLNVNESYFSDCPRSDKGWCESSGEGGGGSGGRKGNRKEYGKASRAGTPAAQGQGGEAGRGIFVSPHPKPEKPQPKKKRGPGKVVEDDPDAGRLADQLHAAHLERIKDATEPEHIQESYRRYEEELDQSGIVPTHTGYGFKNHRVNNAFCPTGKDRGQDNSCSLKIRGRRRGLDMNRCHCGGSCEKCKEADPDETEPAEVENSFCPTGEGGGVDPSCGKEGGGHKSDEEKEHQRNVEALFESGRKALRREEERAGRHYAKERQRIRGKAHNAFCPTGEGGGMDNSCDEQGNRGDSPASPPSAARKKKLAALGQGVSTAGLPSMVGKAVGKVTDRVKSFLGGSKQTATDQVSTPRPVMAPRPDVGDSPAGQERPLRPEMTPSQQHARDEEDRIERERAADKLWEQRRRKIDEALKRFKERSNNSFCPVGNAKENDEEDGFDSDAQRRAFFAKLSESGIGPSKSHERESGERLTVKPGQGGPSERGKALERSLFRSGAGKLTVRPGKGKPSARGEALRRTNERAKALKAAKAGKASASGKRSLIDRGIDWALRWGLLEETKNSQAARLCRQAVANALVANYIKQKPDGSWCVYSEDGKRLGEYPTRAAAEKRLKQIEYFKHTKNKGTNMAFKRQPIIDFLTANCSCWKGKTAVLNDMSDDDLRRFAEAYNVAKRNELIVANVEDGIDLGDCTLIFNERAEPVLVNADGEEMPMKKKGPQHGQSEEEGGGEDEFGDEMVDDSEEDDNPSSGTSYGQTTGPDSDRKVYTGNRRRAAAARRAAGTSHSVNSEEQMTENQWLANAPAAIREQVEYGQRALRNDKLGIVRKLVANVADPRRRHALGERLMRESIGQLEERLELLGPTANDSRPGVRPPIYVSGGYNEQVDNVSEQEDEADVSEMTPPIANYHDDIIANKLRRA